MRRDVAAKTTSQNPYERQKLLEQAISFIKNADDQRLVQIVRFFNYLDVNESAQLTRSKPERAPELWQPRGGKKREKITDFILRVYGPYLDGSFTRADLRSLDTKCYQALSNWLRTNELPESVNLPTKKERYDHVLSNISSVDTETVKALEAKRHRDRRKRFIQKST